MSKVRVASLVVACLISFGVGVGIYVRIKSDNAVKNTPEKLVPAIERIVMSWGQPQIFNQDSPDEGTSYTLWLYSRYSMYEVAVDDWKNGRRGLSIGHYKTNVDFGSMKSPADAVGRELIYGRGKIAIEEHMYTGRADGQLDMYQTFMKKRGPVFMGFTREERDLGEKAGVKQMIFDNGAIFENYKTRKADAEEIAELQSAYLENLKAILRQLKNR